MLFSGPKVVHCLKTPGTGYEQDKILGSVPKGTRFRVVDIHEESSVDGFGVVVYLLTEGSNQTLAVDDLQVRSLFALPAHGR
jgi:hypothetical protein